MIVYVVYWVDLDNDCLKKSEIHILGVYDDELKAKHMYNKFAYKKGYCDDDRCYYVNMVQMVLNIPSAFAEDPDLTTYN